MSEFIYVVVKSYDDSYNSNVFATIDKEKAESKVIELKEKQKIYLETLGKLNELNEKILKELGPVPIGKIIDIPKWPSGMKESMITQEMRDERSKIKLLNEKTRFQYTEDDKIRVDFIKEKEFELLKPLGYKLTDKIYDSWKRHDDNIDYYIEEVEVI